MIRIYNSLGEIAEHYQTCGAAERRSKSHKSDWYDHESVEDTLRLCTVGNEELVPEAERIIAKLETQIETERPSWERAPIGAFCVVPDVLAGIPTPMRRLVRSGSENAPIAIFACSTISAGVSTSDIRKRGTTILALVLALSRIRPISLWSVSTLHGADKSGETVLLTRLETAPMNTSQVCWALTSAGFARRINHDLATTINKFNGNWPMGWSGLGENYLEGLRQRLTEQMGLETQNTLMIGSTHLDDPLLRNPLEWINRQIHKFTRREE